MQIQRFRLSLILLISISVSACAVESSSDDSSNSSNNSVIGTETDGSDSIFDNTPLLRASIFCGTEDPDDDTLGALSSQFGNFAASGASRISRGEFEIPVHFHVIAAGNSEEEGQVSDNALIEQVNVLNQAYNGNTGGINTPFRFALASINRVDRPEWHVIGPGTEVEMAVKETLRIGGPETLNVYLGTIDGGSLEGASGTVLGYATLPVFYGVLPSYDGIVMNFNAIAGGKFERYSLGHVLVHEVGHWLGLLHTFQGECDGFFDDLVEDTPREMIPSEGEFCPVGRDSCEQFDGIDPINNHMTYTEDGCRFEFTEGQLSFMRFNASVFRQMPI